jgi:hypothetical protein
MVGLATPGVVLVVQPLSDTAIITRMIIETIVSFICLIFPPQIGKVTRYSLIINVMQLK